MHFFQWSLFLAVLVYRFLACFLISSVHLVAGLSGLLNPLLGYPIVAAFAQRLWSCLTICPAHFHLMSWPLWYLLFPFFLGDGVCLMIFKPNLQFSLSIFVCTTCSDFFAVGWVSIFRITWIKLILFFELSEGKRVRRIRTQIFDDLRNNNNYIVTKEGS